VAERSFERLCVAQEMCPRLYRHSSLTLKCQTYRVTKNSVIRGPAETYRASPMSAAE